MTILTERYVREKAFKEKENLRKGSNQILRESSRKFEAKVESFDIFLSHSIKDADLVLGVKKILENLGFSVYVDWIDDYDLEREKVDKKTAEILRRRMNRTKALFYIATENSKYSKWMPWECGYFDGKIGKVAIFPIKNDYSKQFKSVEYLELYPWVMEEYNQLIIADGNKKINNLDKWLKNR